MVQQYQPQGFTPQYNPANGALATGLGVPTVLFQSPANTTINASGNSGLINMAGISACWLSVFAAGTSTGTSPTLDVYYDQMDGAGNLLTGIVHAVQLTAAPASTSLSFGAFINPLSGIGGGLVIAPYGRVQWVVGGTTPSYPNVTISLIGR